MAFLQAELSQRDWTLQEREAAQKVLEQGLRAKIGQLEIQLEQIKTSTERPAQEFVLGVNWESEARLDRYLEAARTARRQRRGNRANDLQPIWQVAQQRRLEKTLEIAISSAQLAFTR